MRWLGGYANQPSPSSFVFCRVKAMALVGKPYMLGQSNIRTREGASALGHYLWLLNLVARLVLRIVGRWNVLTRYIYVQRQQIIKNIRVRISKLQKMAILNRMAESLANETRFVRSVRLAFPTTFLRILALVFWMPRPLRPRVLKASERVWRRYQAVSASVGPPPSSLVPAETEQDSCT